MERMRRQEKGKAETNEQREKSNRNQGKLANAEEVYQACRDKWCEECDDILIPAKSDFLKMALRVVQFQQTLYKATAKKAEKLGAVIEVPHLNDSCFQALTGCCACRRCKPLSRQAIRSGMTRTMLPTRRRLRSKVGTRTKCGKR